MDTAINPVITVVMPVYNAAPFLKEAIESILNQTFQDFELLIFDDGSSDNSAAIIGTFRDRRIRFFQSESNQGYVYHLNEGIRRATGKYIARMDADDICERERFDRQISFMENNSEIGICGTQVVIIDEKNQEIERGKHDIDDKDLRIRLFVDSCFAHPTVMMRKVILTDNTLMYDEKLVPAEDYDLWERISSVTKIANLPDVLLKYRWHHSQITNRKESLRKASAAVIRRRIVEKFINRALTKEEFELHNSLLTQNYILTREYVINAKRWLEFLTDHNHSNSKYSIPRFDEQIGRIWFSLSTHAFRLRFWIIVTFFSAGITRKKISKPDMIKFVLKSMLKI